MLTTDTARPATTGPLVAATAVTGAVGLALVAAGAAVEGAAAAYGSLLGLALALAVFAFGSFAVAAVSRLLPAASLLFAMVTYTFQVVLMALVFVAVNRAGLLEETLDRQWLGGTIIACALTWSAAQVRAATTARIPVYEGGAR